ncbi:MAG: hypothetical protein R3A46_11035 [Thermomicrobiales bacterium]
MTYIGMTNGLERSVYEHRLVPGYTSRYNVDRIVHTDELSDVQQAMDRDLEIKGWSRSKKINPIEESNPGRHGLSAGWFRESG